MIDTIELVLIACNAAKTQRIPGITFAVVLCDGGVAANWSRAGRLHGLIQPERSDLVRRIPRLNPVIDFIQKIDP